MKRINLLLVGLLCVSVMVYAGEVITNGTGEDAIGLRVVFSSPVLITDFGDILTVVDTQMFSFEFTFSGGTVEPWGSHWLNWTPATAQISEHEWLTEDSNILQGSAAADVSDQPIVTGDLLNPDYFAHPAYVIQGVSDRDSVFAMPLNGIEELEFYPIVGGADLKNIDWSVEVSHPEGIGANIEGNTLYIWGNNASWTGYGKVTLEAVLGDASSSVTIPVTVFRVDKTLISAKGKKEYFVPWSPELDINRILSVEEHMRTYSKDEGELERSIQWSRWKRMEYMRDATFSTFWPVDLNTPGTFWPLESQYAFVDVLLAELRSVGFNAVRVKNPYYSFGLTATEFQPVYDNFNAGVSKRPEESRYVIDEAHRLGMKVIMSNWIGIDTRSTGGVYHETWQASPSPIDEYWENYQALMLDSMKTWQELGVDIAAIADSLELIKPRTLNNMSKTSDWFEEIAVSSRQYYDGPTTCFTSCQWLPGSYIAEAPFWSSVDILAPAINDDYQPHVLTFNASLRELIASWDSRIEEYFQPFQQKLNKPFLAYHAGCPSVDGAAMWGVQFYSHYPLRMTANYLDLEEQQLWYASALTAFGGMEGFFGLGAFWYDFMHFLSGGVNDIGLTPRLKPAEWYLAEVFNGEAISRPIRVDGSAADWTDTGILIEDPSGDNRAAGDDILWVRGTQDGAHLYLGLQYSASPQGGLTVWLDTDENNQWDFYIGIGPNPGNQGTWLGNVQRNGLPNRSVGVADIAVAGGFVEVRLNRRYIDGYQGPIRIRVTDANSAWTADDDTIPLWTMIPAT